MWVRDYRSRLRKLEAVVEARLANAPARAALVQIIPESGASTAQRHAAKAAAKEGVEVIQCFVVDTSLPELEFP